MGKEKKGYSFAARKQSMEGGQVPLTGKRRWGTNEKAGYLCERARILHGTAGGGPEGDPSQNQEPKGRERNLNAPIRER